MKIRLRKRIESRDELRLGGGGAGGREGGPPEDLGDVWRKE